MNYGNCKCCGKATSYKDIPLCENCNTNYKRKVKEFVLKFPNSTIDDVAKGTAVPAKIVSYYAKVGVVRLVSQEIADRKKKLQLLAMKGLIQEKPKSRVSEDNDWSKAQMRYFTPEKLAEIRAKKR